jgi:translation initiation factor IF-2
MMRIHEFAKKHNLVNKQLIEILHKEGFEAKSHMSVLSEKAIVCLERTFLNKSFEKQTSEEKQIAPIVVQEKVKPEVLAPIEAKKVIQTSVQKKTIISKLKSKPIIQAELEKASSIPVEAMTVGKFANLAKLSLSSVILTLLKQGKPCSVNHLLSEDEVVHLCKIYELESCVANSAKKDLLEGKVELSLENTQVRLPVVVVMGHVDHGKTTLLDFIRKTRVAAKEKGGITQHLGAYQVKTKHGKLVFLDTPGHEAFSKIRKRGASVADIAILIVAADDGIMPQTVESIKAIKALGITMIVAINKIDRVDEQRLDVIKRQLTQHDLLPEEWGGQIMVVPISAKEGKNVDHLLEMVALQAEMMDLRASTTATVQGYILESRMLKGRGSVATVLCRQGILRVGDYFKAGSVAGKVTSLTDSAGQPLKEVGSSVPVQITGFSELPPVGSLFDVIQEFEYKTLKNDTPKNSEMASRLSVSDDAQKFNVILKADMHSSLEAIIDGLKKMPQAAVKEIVVLRSGIGNITESDALLAESTGATIIGFSVKAEQSAVGVARNAEVSIHIFDIIYKLFEKFEELAAREKVIKTVLTKIGQATVLKVFNIKKLGVIAGCIVNDGRFSAKGVIVILRARKEVARGKIKSLQRDKKSVKEVHTGFECAFIVEGFENWQEGDIAECYIDIAA